MSLFYEGRKPGFRREFRDIKNYPTIKLPVFIIHRFYQTVLNTVSLSRY